VNELFWFVEEMNKEENHYQVLGVDLNASMEKITKAYRKQALLLHPDRNSSPNATEMFKVLQKAYEILSNDTTRNEYNGNMDFDNDDDNDILFDDHGDHAQLHMGKKWSEDFVEKIDNWTNEYQHLNICDNFREELTTVLKDTLEQFGDYFDADEKINKYNMCQTCKQSFLSLDDHEYQVTKSYKKLFEVSQNASISKKTALVEIDKQLKKSLKPSIWNWIPAVFPTEYAYLWSSPEWQCIQTMIDQIKEPIQILESTSFIDGSSIYIIEDSDKYRQHENVATNLIKASCYPYLLEAHIIEEIKTILSDVYKSYINDTKSKSPDVNRMTTATRVPFFDESILSNNHQQLLNKYINMDDFYYTVQKSLRPPPNNAQRNCTDCRKKFSMFRHRHPCQMCGTMQCCDCQLCEKVPHLGYTGPVMICRPCATQRLLVINKTIYDCLRQAIQMGTAKCLNIYLALLQHFTMEDLKSYYRQSGDYFFQLQNYSLALQCYYYTKIEYNELLNIITIACLRENYSLAVTCIEMITKLYDKNRKLLLEKVAEYHTLSKSSVNDSYTYAIISLLFSAQAKANCQNILSKCIDFDEAGNHDVCLLYLLYIKSKHYASVNWKQVGEDFLQANKFQLAIFCFHAAKLAINNWIQHLDLLCSQGQYSTVALMLTLINKMMHQHLVKVDKTRNSVIFFLSQILLSRHEQLQDWINYAALLMQQNADSIRIIWCLVFICARFNSNWINLKNNYYSRKQREQVLLCCKMEQTVDTNDGVLLTFSGDIFQTNPSLAMELLSTLNIEWKILGDHYFNEKKYEQALTCYLKSNTNNINK
jgi:curved DNA-binding protein CbpA